MTALPARFWFGLARRLLPIVALAVLLQLALDRTHTSSAPVLLSAYCLVTAVDQRESGWDCVGIASAVVAAGFQLLTYVPVANEGFHTCTIVGQVMSFVMMMTYQVAPLWWMASPSKKGSP